MNKPKYFLYARKSTEEDDKQIMSIEAQLFELREFAHKENLEILEEFQESKSAKTPGRAVFGEMMSKVEEMGNVGILAWHPDRLARNSIDGGRVIYAVDQKNIVSRLLLIYPQDFEHHFATPLFLLVPIYQSHPTSNLYTYRKVILFEAVPLAEKRERPLANTTASIFLSFSYNDSSDTNPRYLLQIEP